MNSAILKPRASDFLRLWIHIRAMVVSDFCQILPCMSKLWAAGDPSDSMKQLDKFRRRLLWSYHEPWPFASIPGLCLKNTTTGCTGQRSRFASCGFVSSDKMSVAGIREIAFHHSHVTLSAPGLQDRESLAGPSMLLEPLRQRGQ